MDARNELRKDKATWSRMSEEIARLIARTVGTRETIVIIETEFNKHGIETYEPFDGYLKEQIDIFKRHGNIKTVVGFGNWGKSNWSRFDRAAAAADYVGVQLLRSSVRDASIYLDAVDTLVTSAQHLHTTFGKPALVTDLALSSYPSTSYETYQDVVFDELFRRSSELKDAGVRAILYRMLSDDPTFDTSNYHGIAERHWGLLRADGSAKPAFSRVVSGLNAENTPPTSGTPPTTPPRKGKTKTARNVKAAAHGRSITVEWDAPADTTGVTGYVLEAGSASGAADLAVVPSAARSLTAANVPDGTYYLRVRPIVDGETGTASDEVTTTVTASPPCVRPPAPSLSVALAGTLVTLRWTTSAAQPATAYSLEVGSSPGQTNLLRTTVAGGQSSLTVNAPLGTYFVRLAAVNVCGASAASNEVVVSVR